MPVYKMNLQSNLFSITTFNVTLCLLSQNFSSPASSHTKYPLCTAAIVTPSNITKRSTKTPDGIVFVQKECQQSMNWTRAPTYSATHTSQLCRGQNRKKNRIPSDRLRPFGSLVTGIPAETMARATKSFKVWCLAGLPGAFLQSKLCSPWASTRDPQWQLCGIINFLWWRSLVEIETSKVDNDRLYLIQSFCYWSVDSSCWAGVAEIFISYHRYISTSY